MSTWCLLKYACVNHLCSIIPLSSKLEIKSVKIFVKSQKNYVATVKLSAWKPFFLWVCSLTILNFLKGPYRTVSPNLVCTTMAADAW